MECFSHVCKSQEYKLNIYQVSIHKILDTQGSRFVSKSAHSIGIYSLIMDNYPISPLSNHMAPPVHALVLPREGQYYYIYSRSMHEAYLLALFTSKDSSNST